MFALLGRSLLMWPQKIRAAMLLVWFGAFLLIMPADAQMPRPANSQPGSRASYPPLRFAEQTGSPEINLSRSVLSSNQALAMPITEEERAPMSSDDNESLRFENHNENFYFANGQATCDSTGNCTTCGNNNCWGCDGWDLFPNCTPPGLLQWLHAKHEACGSCWSGQVDAVLLWRNSPPTRELVTFSGGGGSALDAHQLESALAGGPRLGVSHKDSCGNIAEFVYLRAFNFRSQRSLPTSAGFYEINNLFGVGPDSIDTASTNLGSSFQTFEANSKTPIGAGSFNFIAGFRWLEFQESFSLDTRGAGVPTATFRSDTVNSLYGGQLGIDAWILTMPLVQINTWLKGGAYYNNAVQHTSLQTTAPLAPGIGSFSQSVARSPAAGSFVGEVGINGTMPLAPCVDFRFGYTAFWLETIAMATQQLENQNVLSTNGGTVLQGINFGLEGKW